MPRLVELTRSVQPGVVTVKHFALTHLARREIIVATRGALTLLAPLEAVMARLIALTHLARREIIVATHGALTLFAPLEAVMARVVELTRLAQRDVIKPLIS